MKVAATWIAWNAVETVAASVAALWHVADEFVVVDADLRTGRVSHDGTWDAVAAIARNAGRAGKRFVHVQGVRGLYHEAHNLALSHVSPDAAWILQPDADEVFVPGELSQLHPLLLAAADGIGFRWPFVLRFDGRQFFGPTDPRRFPDAVMRAYRNAPGLRFVCTNGVSEAPVDGRGTIQHASRRIVYPATPRLFHYHCFETPGRFLDKHLFYRSAEKDGRRAMEEETENLLRHFDPATSAVPVAWHPLADAGLQALAASLSDGLAYAPTWPLT
jgi:hypothetical protein